MIRKFNLKDIVQTRKEHPCGSNEWEVIRLGADVKMKCQGCSRIIMLTRGEFEKAVKKVVKSAEDELNFETMNKNVDE
jgi:hypothetical protein